MPNIKKYIDKHWHFMEKYKKTAICLKTNQWLLSEGLKTLETFSRTPNSKIQTNHNQKTRFTPHVLNLGCVNSAPKELTMGNLNPQTPKENILGQKLTPATQKMLYTLSPASNVGLNM